MPNKEVIKLKAESNSTTPIKKWLKLQKRGKSELELQISVNFFSVIENILQ